MPEKQLPTEQILALLTENPQRIAALTARVRAAQLYTPPANGEWSVNDILAHLRSCSDVWGDCIAKILSEDAPTIRAVNPWTWLRSKNYLKLKFKPSLRAFLSQRAALLVMLETLSAEDWTRTATVTGAGKPLERSVLSYAQWLATHERSHVKQIARLLQE